MGLRRLITWWAALAVAGLVAMGVATQVGATTPTPHYVGRSGTELVVAGRPWKFGGYNLPCANPFLLTSAQLGYYLDDIRLNSGANVVRLWFFQSQGGPGRWTRFDNVLAALKARGMRAILTLTNQSSTCDEPRPNGPVKTVAWYQGGYKSSEGGYPLSFRDYAQKVAARYAGTPTVAFWQLVNEASAPTLTPTGGLTCDNASAMTALRSFSDDMAGVIHNVDRHHLVNLGTRGPFDCGIADPTSYRYVHAGALDLCEYHDYGQPAVPLSASLQQAVSACHALGKPLFIGESGIPANVQPDGNPATTCSPWPTCSPDPITFTTFDQRAAFFRAKIAAANRAGLAGYVIWVKSPYYSATTEGYAVGDGDPAEPVLRSARNPYP